ncbi:hypothetical protein HYV50_01735 [Candidatus Pacearchaeota archaeon]|nr:hypothetical protein [Candidatus Pacearchaeota archaeon]
MSGFYKNIPLIIIYAKTLNWFELGLSFLFSIIIGFLVSINSVLLYLNYKERKKCTDAKTLASLGTLGGLATGVCPLCLTGLFPLILGAIGISFSFASLPFNGLEVQALVILVLSASLYSMTKR